MQSHLEASKEQEMKFRDSPVIDLQVRDAKLSLHQDNGSIHVGTTVWPCSLVLVKFAERWLSDPVVSPNPYAPTLDFAGKRAVEIGSGCAAAGMGLYFLGLKNILLTDIEAVMPALRHNLKRNKPVLGKTLKTAVLYWKNLEQMKSLNPPFDLVIATDVVYIDKDVPALVAAMEFLVADSGAVLLGYQLRCPDAHRLFWDLCEKVFSVRKVPHHHLHPQYAFEEADVYILKKL